MKISLLSKENSEEIQVIVRLDGQIIHQNLHHINCFRKDEVHSFEHMGVQKNYTTYDNGEDLHVCLHDDRGLDISNAVSADSIKDPFAGIFIA